MNDQNLDTSGCLRAVHSNVCVRPTLANHEEPGQAASHRLKHLLIFNSSDMRFKAINGKLRQTERGATGEHNKS